MIAVIRRLKVAVNTFCCLSNNLSSYAVAQCARNRLLVDLSTSFETLPFAQALLF